MPLSCLPIAPSARYWDMRNQRPHRYITAAMIEGAFKRGPHWQGMEAELAKPFDPASADPQALATTK